MAMRSHYCGDVREASIGEEVEVAGWVHNRRDHGGVIFVDLRDASGLLQIVDREHLFGRPQHEVRDLRRKRCSPEERPERRGPCGSVLGCQQAAHEACLLGTGQELWHSLPATGEAHFEKTGGERVVRGDLYRTETVRHHGPEPVLEIGRQRLPAGSVRVDLDQPLGLLAALLLEPASPDSFFQWGMMLEVLQRTEYFEDYALEPMARKMLENDPELAREFEERLTSDEEFAGNARARLEFFYERTPYFDQEYRVYPVMRETN